MRFGSTGFPFILVMLASLLLMHSCRKDNPYENSDARLIFSEDTVMFDTVFTQLGGSQNPRSVNKRFTIRNPYNQPIRTDIRLAGGSASPFRINIDGIPQLAIKDFEIRPNDSVYVFVEATLDQTNQNNPLIIKDSIEITTNGNKQDVKLIAWGQDAYYFDGHIQYNDTAWMDANKPYVIFNSTLVAEGATLTIGPGVDIYSDVESRLFVAGTIRINGTKDNPVVFQGARLGAAFEDIPSQWWGIRLLPRSENNRITYTEVRNGVIGIQVDSLQDNGGAKLILENTIIKNMSAAGLLCYTSRVTATNLLSTNCGQYTFLGELGGNYTFRHCTFAMYNTTFSHTKPAFGLSNADYEDVNGTITANDLSFNIQNCIIYGNLDEELVFFEGGQGTFNGTFTNCLMKTEMGPLPGTGNLYNQGPQFVDYRELNFELEEFSPAIDAATALFPPVSIDVRGEARDADPDIGAYERIK